MSHFAKVENGIVIVKFPNNPDYVPMELLI
jgi:hypothetical protein